MRTRFNYDTSNKSIMELISLHNKVAVIVGASKGLGYAIAERLAEAGATIIIADLNPINADLSVQKIAKKYAVRSGSFSIDPTDLRSVSAMIADIMQTYGRIDIWINNAGLYSYEHLLDLTDEDSDRIMEKNLKGAFIGCRQVTRCMMEEERGGVIINLGDVMQRGYHERSCDHLASTIGITRLTKAFAGQYGKHGIRVIAVTPSTAETIPSNGNTEISSGNGIDGNIKLPLGRVAIPDDIARVVLFCASDLSMFMTGTVVTVDGGETYY